jgi:hypothetical protein
MRPVRLSIAEIAVEVPTELGPRDVEATLRAALALLADRLARAPLAPAAARPARALARLELAPLPPDWVAGPGGAARLAEELYERIAGRLP